MDLSNFKNYLLLNCGAKKSAECHLSKLVDFYRHNTEFTQESVNNFLVSKQEVWKSTTFNVYLNAFKHYAKFLKLELEWPHFRKVNVSAKPYLKDKEIEDIIIKCPLIFDNARKAQVILTLLFEGGLRPKELLSLKRDDFDFEEKTVTIKNTKVHRDRVLPLSDKTIKMIEHYFHIEAGEENAFNINFETLKYIFLRINKCLNIKISPYELRRSYAKNMLRKGLELSSLQLNMGHANINSTLTYLSVDADEAREQARTILNRKRRT